jgi:hypothetical protein
MTVKWKLPNAGRAYAYVGQIGGFALSFWANIRDAYIPEIPQGVAGAEWREGYPGYKPIDPSDFDLVSAGFFPVALFIAIELLARVQWSNTKIHTAIRWGGVGSLLLVALVVSYSHLRTGFLLAGWGQEMATLAPLAIDGFMAVCTVVLLTTAHQAPKDLDQPIQENHHQDPSQPAQVMDHHPLAGLDRPVAHAAAIQAPAATDPEPIQLDRPAVDRDEAAAQEPIQAEADPSVRVVRDTSAKPDRSKPRATRKAASKAKPIQAGSDPANVARAIELIQGGMTERAAAAETGVSRGAIQREKRRRAETSADNQPSEPALTEEEVARLSEADLDEEFANLLKPKPNDET